MPDGRGVEVISVVHRRRRWTVEQKLSLVEEMSRPGASAAAIADRHGLSRSLLFDWRRQARDGTMPSLVRAGDGVGFAPVKLLEASPPPAASARPKPTSRPAAVVELVLPNGRVLRVSETIRPEVLGRLATALES